METPPGGVQGAVTLVDNSYSPLVLGSHWGRKIKFDSFVNFAIINLLVLIGARNQNYERSGPK